MRVCTSRCVVFPRLSVSFRVPLRRLPASPKIFPRLSASVRVSMHRLSASLCAVSPRLPIYLHVSLCLSASLCVALPRLCASFHVCLRRSSFRISLRLSCSLRRVSISLYVFPRISASAFRVSLMRSALLCVVRLRLSPSLCAPLRHYSASLRVFRRLSGSLSTSLSLLCPSYSHFGFIFLPFDLYFTSFIQ